jgi:Ribbon-helix-helix protein, copG family
MAKTRTTLTIDEDVLRAVKLRAVSSGRGDSEVIEQALRAQLGLDFLDAMWAKASLAEDDATKLAVEAQHKTRRPRRS